MEIEGKYHTFTNAGHISYVELDGDTVNNIDAFEKVVRIIDTRNTTPLVFSQKVSTYHCSFRKKQYLCSQNYKHGVRTSYFP